MADLTTRLQGDLVAARKAQDKPRTVLLSTILSDAKNRRIELQRDLTDDDGALNIYEQGAKYGQDVLAVYAPNEQAREGAHKILSANLANHIKYYGQFAITDFS